MKDLSIFHKQDGFVNLRPYTAMELSPLAKEKKKEITHEIKGTYKVQRKTVYLTTIGLNLFSAGLLCIICMITAEDGFKHAMKVRGYWFYIGIVLFTIGAFLLAYWIVYGKKKVKDAIKEGQEKKNAQDELIKEDFGAGESAIKIDIMSPLYKTNRKGEMKESVLFHKTYQNHEFIVFFNHDDLCLVYNEIVYSLTSVENIDIKVVDKKLEFMGWNKPDPAYPNYKKEVSVYGHGTIMKSKGYAIVTVTFMGEEGYFIIPKYDILAFQKLVDFNR